MVKHSPKILASEEKATTPTYYTVITVRPGTFYQVVYAQVLVYR